MNGDVPTTDVSVKVNGIEVSIQVFGDPAEGQTQKSVEALTRKIQGFVEAVIHDHLSTPAVTQNDSPELYCKQ